MVLVSAMVLVPDKGLIIGDGVDMRLNLIWGDFVHGRWLFA